MAIPMITLSQVFRLKHAAERAGKAIVVRRAGAPVAFAVDRMLGQQEVVIRPVDDVLIRAPGISGATDLGDGQPTLVLDLVALSVSLSAASAALETRDEAARGVLPGHTEYALTVDGSCKWRAFQVRPRAGHTLRRGIAAFAGGGARVDLRIRSDCQRRP